MLQNLRKFIRKPLFWKKKNQDFSREPTKINPNSLEAIKTLRIPKIGTENYDEIKIDGILENFSGEYLSLSEIINKTIKDLQDLFKKPSKDLEINAILTHKDELIENGITYKENGDNFAAFTNFYFAFQLANKLNQKDEAEVLLELINDLKTKLNKKTLDRFNKKYVKTSKIRKNSRIILPF